MAFAALGKHLKPEWVWEAPGRSRLGAEPVSYLFDLTAERWGLRAAEADRWQGLSLYGLDGGPLEVIEGLR